MFLGETVTVDSDLVSDMVKDSLLVLGLPQKGQRISPQLGYHES